ncbi:hypothetical protein [Pontixanthobacter sp. CEM42]|uniref:hypothetical protein n=1 Tax=Pontixanthobacter sp. CEM42 TaxID=2792077 RepID=UPI001ADF73DC|nr:hypothetical protein [Pontixanthobacter sp. CEM42]
MSFWQIDLTTRAGAHTATSQGAIGCFIFAGLAMLGMLILGGAAGFTTTEGITAVVAVGLEVVVGLVAGFRMRAGKGAFWGIATAALLAFEMVVKIVTLTGLLGLVINGVVLVLIVQGIRGALALRGDAVFDDDDVEVFE